MAEYRLYFVGQGGHYASVETFCCLDDETAIKLATTYADGPSMELWNQNRKVKVFTRAPVEMGARLSV